MRAELPQDPAGNGISGTLRLTAMALVALLAALGIGVVLDIISLQAFGEFAKRFALIGCISGLAFAALGLLGFKRL